jgi:plastocyanin
VSSSSQTIIQLPVNRAVRVLLCALACWPACAPAASLLVNVLDRDGRPLPGAVITAEPEASPSSAAQPVQAIMDQVNLAFLPDVLVVPVHSRVQFPNSDAVGHQVYSFSSARQFQLPLYRGKPYPPVQFDQPGVVTLGCNIHDNMIGYIFVTAAPYFGRTDARGEWQGRDLPAGRIRVHVWHPLLGEPREPERSVDLAGDHGSVEFRLVKPLRPAPLSGRPRSWDY